VGAVSVTVVDRSGVAIRRYDEASRLGLDAAANHLRVEIVKAFGSSYYKGGRFRSTLQVKQSIRKLMPSRSGTGWETSVGTKFIEALYWELGHRNAFTRKYERVQLWVPTAVDNIQRMQKTFSVIVARIMGAA
jgi:hypothetical protein